jgi:signal transduction histidine kinase/ligand-binding sensor domain-containing protein/AraC-like DNA-binding protein/ActR/RegA family two-component response regulator
MALISLNVRSCLQMVQYRLKKPLKSSELKFIYLQISFTAILTYLYIQSNFLTTVTYKNNRTGFYLLIFFSFLYSLCVRADQGYYFKQISLSEGLTQSTVRCILNDRKGFIWIGTKSGLNRFDRYSLKSYFHKKEDPNSIPGNQIHFIQEDVAGNIWIATDNGLVRYNPGKDNFTVVTDGGKPVLVRSATEIKGEVLFGGSGTIYKADISTKTVTRLKTSNQEKLSDMFIGMKVWYDDNLLLRTRRNGVWTFNSKTNVLARLPFIGDKEIMALYVDGRKQIWVAPYGKGIRSYDQKGTAIANYNSGNSGLNNDVVLDILERDHKLWIATDGGGINILNLQTQTFSILKHIPGNSSSLPENSILTLYNDSENNLWAGSIRGGLIAIRKVFINTYKDAPLNSIYGLSEKTVLSIYEDRSGILWIGTDGGGINRFDPAKMTFKHYPPTYGYKIASITDFRENQLLISAFSKGLYIFNKLTGTITPFHTDINEQRKYIQASGIAINVNKVSDQKIYLFADQVLSYDITDRSFSPVKFNAASNAYSSLLKIYSDQTATYLFGPYGIFELDHALNKIKPVFEIEDNNDPIVAASRDHNGGFWLGTNDGLRYYDPKKKQIKRIETNLFNEISALVLDKQNRLWIGAQNMVFLYLIKEHKFIAFGESDGVVPNEFLFKPSLVTENGDIYLGGVKGLLHINRNIPVIESTPPVIELMGLTLNGVPLDHDLKDKSNAVSIPWNHSSLIVKVMGREEDVFRKKMFRFEIRGLDVRAIETYDHTLNIGSLPSGSYRIIVSCSLKDGGWSKPVEVLRIAVTPPWFKSFWFIFLVLLVAGATIAWFYRMAITRKERKLQWDMKEHEQKTYEAKIRFLINISHELRTPLTLIYSPLQRLLSRKNTDEELTKKLTGVYNQARHMKEIIDMVLDVRKIELGQEKLNLGYYDLNNWVIKITDPFLNEFEANNIKLQYHMDETIGKVPFDQKKCEIILMNLLINALKFSRPDTTVILTTSKIGHFIRVAVTDEGIGLDHANLNELFKPFYQGMHQQHGSGIGLSFSKILVEMQGGRIDAFNNAEKGATFYFELPAEQTMHAVPLQDGPVLTTPFTIVDAAPSLDNDNFVMTSYTLLIVEDEPELRQFLKENLQPYFKKVIAAEDGLKALDAIEAHHPDIIVSDIMMPGIDGFELCKLIKADINISHIPVVLLTTQGDAESRNTGYKLGADAYISKPFELDFLQTILGNLLKNREALKLKYKSTGLFVSPGDGTFSNADELFMTKLNTLITDNLEDEHLDVDFLTDKMAMSRATLYGKLKSIADIGVNDYINKFRLDKAVYLLVNSDKNINEIADVTGFSNQRYFSTVFKQFYHATPTLYRKTHGKPAD